MLNYLPKYFTTKAILLYIVLLIFNFFIFGSSSLPAIWIAFGLVTVISFFHFTNLLTKRWRFISEKSFIEHLFIIAITIRIIWVLFSYFFYDNMTGKPFEFGATDTLWYHKRAKDFMDSPFSYLRIAEPSNSGYIIYLSIIYNIFGVNILIPRLIKALISAYTCIIIYRLATRNFGIKAGRIAGIISMLMPNLIYYCGLHLRETEMVFLLVFFAERTDFALRKYRLSIKHIIIPFLLLILLFFFRTVIGGVAVLSLLSTITISSNRIVKWHKRVMFGIVAILFAAFLFGSKISKQVEKYWGERDTNQTISMQDRTKKAGGNKYAKYGTSTIFIPFILPAPFPTMVFIDKQENIMLLNGTYYARNIYAFFVILAFVLLTKRKSLRNHILILTILIGYLLVIASSGFALAERFHMPIVPFLIIFASYGITQMNNRSRKYYIPYLILIAVIIVGWNWFKLAGRGYI